MTYKELLKKQEELFKSIDNLQKSGMFGLSYDKMKEFLDLIERYFTENSICNKLHLLYSRRKNKFHN